MEENFKLEIISPENIIYSDNISMVTFPSYEGDMSVLKDHISIISFLRPGLIKIKKNDSNIVFFAEDGIISFYKNNLSILCTKVINIKDLTKDNIENYNKSILEQLNAKSLTDKDSYILNHKLETIKEINL